MDLATVFLGLFVTLYIRYQSDLTWTVWDSHVKPFSIIFLGWMLVFYIHGLFELDTFRRYTTILSRLASAMVVNVLVAIVYLYFQPELFLTPRRFLLLDAGITFIFLLGWYLLMKAYLQRMLSQNAILLDVGNVGYDLEEELKSRDYLGVKITKRVSVLQANDLLNQRVDTVIIPDELGQRLQLAKEVYELRKLGVNFVSYKNLYELLFRKVPVSELNELWFLNNVEYQQRRVYEGIKRSIDFLAGGLGFVFFILTFPLLSVLVKLSSAGPVFFMQMRVGYDGSEFRIIKYRTMKATQPGNTWTSKDDPRITKIGKILRILRLDELPQCINLLRGDMSLVGPRPEQPHIVEMLRGLIPFYDERHLVKPGLTGWAQINNIYAATLEESREKLQFDLYYIKHRSVVFDLEIILKTIYYVFSFKGR